MSTTVDGVFVIIADSDEGSPNDADNAARNKDMSCYTCLRALYRSWASVVIRGDGYPDSVNPPKIRLNPRTMRLVPKCIESKRVSLGIICIQSLGPEDRDWQSFKYLPSSMNWMIWCLSHTVQQKIYKSLTTWASSYRYHSSYFTPCVHFKSNAFCFGNK